MTDAFFDTKEHLWIELTDQQLPAHLMITRPEIFMVEHAAPGRVMIDLTAYIETLVTRAR